MDKNLKIRAMRVKHGSVASIPESPSSPMISPMISPMPRSHVRSASVGVSNMKKVQTKAAAQRLAAVMAHQPDGEDDNEDDLDLDYNVSGKSSIGLGGRAARSRSPMPKIPRPRRQQVAVQQSDDEDNEDQEHSYGHDSASGRPSIGLAGGRPMPPRSPMNKTPSLRQPQIKFSQSSDEDNEDNDLTYDRSIGSNTQSIGLASARAIRPHSPMNKITPSRRPQMKSPQPNDEDNNLINDYSTGSNRLSIGLGGRAMRPRSPMSVCTNQEQSLSARSSGLRPSANPMEQQPPSAGRPLKAVHIMPATVPISLKPVSPMLQSDSPTSNRWRDKRMSIDFGTMTSFKEGGNQPPASDIQDELDMLVEENESLLEKLRIVEERCEESAARSQLLEKQVATLGEGVTSEARLISRKEAALQQREAALRVTAQTHGGRSEEVSALHTEAEMARDEAASAMEQLHEVESDIKSLRTTALRMILTQEEMEEVVLKRCWLARYWGLCVRHGIQAEISRAKYEYWSSFVPLPIEFVLAAGHRAKEKFSTGNDDAKEREKSLREMYEIYGEGNVESMLLAERGLRELASLKVEEAVALSMAHVRRRNSLKDNAKHPADGHGEAFELSEEESEDVLFKQAWLTYFWGRAKTHRIEPDVAEERIQYWINHNGRSSTSHDALEVERGLMEFKKLNIECRISQQSHRA